jgi:hypothetical protein
VVGRRELESEEGEHDLDGIGPAVDKVPVFRDVYLFVSRHSVCWVVWMDVYLCICLYRGSVCWVVRVGGDLFCWKVGGAEGTSRRHFCTYIFYYI